MAKYDVTNIQGDVEELLVECIGDDQFMEDEEYPSLNLFDEYGLDMYSFVEIIQALNDRFGLGIVPTQIEQRDIDTVQKIVGLVEDYLTE